MTWFRGEKMRQLLKVLVLLLTSNSPPWSRTDRTRDARLCSPLLPRFINTIRFASSPTVYASRAQKVRHYAEQGLPGMIYEILYGNYMKMNKWRLVLLKSASARHFRKDLY